jgi:hypothetical protein
MLRSLITPRRRPGRSRFRGLNVPLSDEASQADGADRDRLVKRAIEDQGDFLPRAVAVVRHRLWGC